MMILAKIKKILQILMELHVNFLAKVIGFAKFLFNLIIDYKHLVISKFQFNYDN
jgi:hypothetical protein